MRHLVELPALPFERASIACRNKPVRQCYPRRLPRLNEPRPGVAEQTAPPPAANQRQRQVGRSS